MLNRHLFSCFPGCQFFALQMEALIEAGGPDCQQHTAPPGPQASGGETGYSEQNSFCPGSRLLIFTSRSWNGHHSVIIKAAQSHHSRLKKINYQAHFLLRLKTSSRLAAVLLLVWRNIESSPNIQGGRIYLSQFAAVLQVGRCTLLQLPLHGSLQQCRSCCIPNFILPDASQMRTMISAGDGGGDVFLWREYSVLGSNRYCAGPGRPWPSYTELSDSRDQARNIGVNIQHDLRGHCSMVRRSLSLIVTLMHLSKNQPVCLSRVLLSPKYSIPFPIYIFCGLSGISPLGLGFFSSEIL